MRNVAVQICLLLTLNLIPGARAADGPIPPDYRGMWGAGGCASPQFFLHIEDSGIQGYGPDKRTPFGNWDVREVGRGAEGIVIETPETNSGKDFHMALSKLRQGWLLIKMRSPDGADQAEFESCSLENQ